MLLIVESPFLNNEGRCVESSERSESVVTAAAVAGPLHHRLPLAFCVTAPANPSVLMVARSHAGWTQLVCGIPYGGKVIGSILRSHPQPNCGLVSFSVPKYSNPLESHTNVDTLLNRLTSCSTESLNTQLTASRIYSVHFAFYLYILC